MWLAVVLGALSLVGAVASALVWRHEARAACLAHEQCATSISEAVRDREALIREQRQLREMIEGLQRGLDEARSSASAQPQQVPGEMARLFRAAQDQLATCRTALEARDELIEALERERKVMQAQLAALKAAAGPATGAQASADGQQQ